VGNKDLFLLFSFVSCPFSGSGYISQLSWFTAHQIMATTASPTPILFSVLTSTHENSNEDFLNQLRNHLNQIETNVQRTLNQIQQRKPYSTLSTNTNQSDPKIRNHFFHV